MVTGRISPFTSCAASPRPGAAYERGWALVDSTRQSHPPLPALGRRALEVMWAQLGAKWLQAARALSYWHSASGFVNHELGGVG